MSLCTSFSYWWYAEVSFQALMNHSHESSAIIESLSHYRGSESKSIGLIVNNRSQHLRLLFVFSRWHQSRWVWCKRLALGPRGQAALHIHLFSHEEEFGLLKHGKTKRKGQKAWIGTKDKSCQVTSCYIWWLKNNVFESCLKEELHIIVFPPSKMNMIGWNRILYIICKHRFYIQKTLKQ